MHGSIEFPGSKLVVITLLIIEAAAFLGIVVSGAIFPCRPKQFHATCSHSEIWSPGKWDVDCWYSYAREEVSWLLTLMRRRHRGERNVTMSLATIAWLRSSVMQPAHTSESRGHSTFTTWLKNAIDIWKTARHGESTVRPLLHATGTPICSKFLDWSISLLGMQHAHTLLDTGKKINHNVNSLNETWENI